MRRTGAETALLAALRAAIAVSFALLFSGMAAAQVVNVTGTIVDPSGVPYSFARVTAALAPSGGQSPTCTQGGSITDQTVVANSAGFFSIQLCANASISTPNTQWNFTIQEDGVPPPLGTGPQTFSVLLTVINSQPPIQDISSVLNAGTLALSAGTLPTNPGQNTQVLFNNNGAVAGAPGFSYTPQSPTGGNVNVNGQAQIGPQNVGGAHLFNYGPLPLPGPNEDGWIAPSNGDPCGVARILSGFPGGGIFQGFPSVMVPPGCGHYVNYGSSGDGNHSTGRITGVTGSVRQNVVCTFSFCQAGNYLIVVNVSAATASCTGSPTVQFFVTYTDDSGGGSVTLPIPLTVNGSPTSAATMGIANNTNKGWGVLGFRNAAANNVSYSATLASPCSVGTASFNYDVEVVETL